MTVALPSLELKLKKEINSSLSNTSSNTNTTNNIINLPNPSELKISDIPEKASSKESLSITPEHIIRFREALLLILIGYFKNNIVLLNNLIELSDNIIMKMEDLIFLISILLQLNSSDFRVDVEDIEAKNCCGKICSKLPRYRRINDIIIKNKSSFKITYNQYYVQMMTEYNISLDYIMI
jgi:hypothetical protein